MNHALVGRTGHTKYVGQGAQDSEEGYKREGMEENVTEMPIFQEERNGTKAVG